MLKIAELGNIRFQTGVV